MPRPRRVSVPSVESIDAELAYHRERIAILECLLKLARQSEATDGVGPRDSDDPVAAAALEGTEPATIEMGTDGPRKRGA